MHENLWAPWRLDYVSQCGEPRDGCFMCNAASGEADDRETLVVARGERCFCILNRYPYSNGHLMVAPKRHEGDFAALEEAETIEMIRAIGRATEVLRRVVRAQGFNIGWNLGDCAGAGVSDHAHAHVVPRWPGDTNFMPVIGAVKVIPQALDEVWEKLRDAWAEGDPE